MWSPDKIMEKKGDEFTFVGTIIRERIDKEKC